MIKLPVTSCQLPAGDARAVSGNRQLTTDNASARAGFTFTEVMFAVILLGIGFIMLAGMFPVAIQQTAQTQQEAVGSSLTLAAVKQISHVASQALMPPTGQWADGSTAPATDYIAPRVLQFRERFFPGPGNTWVFRRTINTDVDPLNPLWKSVRGDLIFSEDPRYAFVPFYQRVPGQNVAKIIIIAVQSQAAGAYEFNRDVITQKEFSTGGRIDAKSPYATLEPRSLEAIISDGGPEVDIIELRTPRGSKVEGADALECAAVGAFVVVSDDGVVNSAWFPTDQRGRGNGRIYRLGARRSDLDGRNLAGGRTWELAPGSDMASRIENLPLPAQPSPFPQVPSDTNSDWYANTDYRDHLGNNPAIVYVIGRPQENPTTANSPYTGPVQDMAAYTTYIKLK